MAKAAPKKPRRAPSGRRAVPVQLWPEDEAAAEVILTSLRAGFPGLRLGLSDAVRTALQEYAKMCAAHATAAQLIPDKS
jgi:hypothetical protein